MIQHTHTDNLQKQTRRLVAPNTNREALFSDSRQSFRGNHPSFSMNDAVEKPNT
jgi:hypothetical protein